MTRATGYLINVVVQGASKAFSLGAGFLAFLLLARVLGSEALGHYAFVMAFIMIAGTAADMGTTPALAQGLGAGSSAERTRYLANYLSLKLLLSLAAFVIVLPAAFLVGAERQQAMLVGCLIVPLATARFFEPVFQIYGRPWYALQAAVALGVCQLGAAIVVLYVLELGVVAYLCGTALAQFVYVLIAALLMFRLQPPRLRFDRDVIRGIVALAAPMGVYGIFNAIYTRADVIMLSYMRSATEVGLYHAAFRLLDIGMTVAITATMPLVPVMTRLVATDREHARDVGARIIEAAAWATLPLPLLTAWYGDHLVLLLYGEAYIGALPILTLFAWLFAVTLCYLLGSSMNLACGEVRYGYWSGAAAAALNIGLNLVLIPRYGGLGAAWATVATSLGMLLVAHHYVRRNLGNLFVAARWLRIALAVALLASALALLPQSWPLCSSVLALVVYFVALAAFGLLPLQAMSRFGARWRRRTISAP